ncbi:hypothetical protein [Paracoccus sphaerophysae]|uniref:hypothetical protein n=1 Tax=Paracoccus sphaerophysae TaxID=690417 RepID=UPI00235465FA|nr:hypothetical protein [Paracoccus sphaerophysae]
MPHWPLALRLILTAAVFGATAWAFAVGQMGLAVVGIVACWFAFQRMFMTL